MENGEEERSVNVRQAVGNAEEKFIRVFRTGEIENRFGSFPCISQRKSLGIIGVSTNYIPMKQTLYFHRKVYVQQPVLAQPVPLPSFRPTVQAYLSTQKFLLNEYVEPYWLADPENSNLH